MAAEAIGRKAVRLDALGQYVEFTLTKAANAVNVHYSIPDSSAALGFGVPGSIVLAPHASLNVVISFVPSPNGDRSGALTVSDATSARRLA